MLTTPDPLPGRLSARGHGLRNIRERAELHGGVADIESDEGTGTELTLEVPLAGLAKRRETG